MEHLSTVQLVAYHERVLGTDELLRVVGHIEKCDRCRRLLARLDRAEDAFAFVWQDLSGHHDDSVATMTPAPPAPEPALVMTHFKQVAAWANGGRRLLAVGAGLALVIAVIVVAILQKRTVPLHGQATQTDETSNRSHSHAGGREESDAPGDIPLPPAGTVLASIVDNGRTVTLDDHGKLNGLEQLPNDWQQSILWAIQHRRLRSSPKPSLTGGQAASLRGPGAAPEGLELIRPVGTVVQSRRPVMAWHALDGARSYEASVFDSAYREVVSSGPLTGTQWRVPLALHRGSIYSWQVIARTGDREVVSPSFPAPEARFAILDENSASDLRRATRILPHSQLLMAMLYARAGLFQKSEGVLRLLQTNNPGSNLVADFLRNLRTAGARESVIPGGAAHH
jgi:hypothetical protein